MKRLLVFIFLAFFLTACSDDKKKKTDSSNDSSVTPNSQYIGTWRYVDSNRNLHIKESTISSYFIAKNDAEANQAPDTFSNNKVLVVLSSNMLAEGRPNTVQKFLIRDGVLDTKVEGVVAKPNSAGVNTLSTNSTINYQGVGNINVIFKNVNTESKFETKTNANGSFENTNIPTGEYDVVASSSKEQFEDKLTINADSNNVGILNIVDEASVNFKAMAEIKSKAYNAESMGSLTRITSDDDNTYTLFTGEHLFMLGGLYDNSTDKYDYYNIGINLKNVSKVDAMGINFTVLCDQAEWVYSCERVSKDNKNNLSFTPGTLTSGRNFDANLLVKLKPFNSESKQIKIPVKITSFDNSIEWFDEVVLQAYKKPYPVKVGFNNSNSGFAVLQENSLLRLTGTRQLINLPFIDNHTYSLAYSNNSSSSQTNYSIALGRGVFPESNDILRLEQNWLTNFEVNNSDATAARLEHHSLNNAYLHQGDLDFYNITIKEDIEITGGDKEQAILNDQSVAGLIDLRFKASFKNKDINLVPEWQQIRGFPVNYTSNNGELEFKTPSLPAEESLVFVVSAIDDEGKEYSNYLSVLVEVDNNAISLINDNDEDFTLPANSLRDKSLSIYKSTSKDSSNSFLLDSNLTLNSLTLDYDTKLIVSENSILTVKENLLFAGATLHIKGTLDLAQVTNPIIPQDTTIILDGELLVKDNLIIEGTLTHSQGHLDGLYLEIPNKLTITATGKIDVTGKGLLGGGSTSRGGTDVSCGEHYTADNEIADLNNNCSAGAGGSYGGLGANSNNPIYGNIEQPVNLGSGGSSRANNYYSGNGGGAVYIKAKEFELDGEILALGEVDENNSGAGAGSGGSVLIELNAQGIFTANGSISVAGGNASNARKGGGGRVAINNYDAVLSRFDIEQISGYGSLWLAALDKAPSIYFAETTSFNLDKNLTLTRLTMVGGLTLTVPTNKTLTLLNNIEGNGGTLEVKGALNLTQVFDPIIPQGVTIVLDGQLLVQDNLIVEGTLTHSQGHFDGLQLKIPNKLTITSAGKIDVTGKGLLGGGSASRGGTDASCGEHYTADNEIADLNNNCSAGAGGSYGGLGANSNNPVYGDIKKPVNLGSGGSSRANNYYSGNGGGAVYIKAKEFKLDGEILALGEVDENNSGAGAGSGGSVLIELINLGVFTANGSISVAGGSASSVQKGGGGRVAIKGVTGGNFENIVEGVGSDAAPNNGTFYTEQ